MVLTGVGSPLVPFSNCENFGVYISLSPCQGSLRKWNVEDLGFIARLQYFVDIFVLSAKFERFGTAFKSDLIKLAPN
jgi:hypothetical protein